MMDSINQYWSETMEIPEARWIVVFSGLVVCIAIGFYVVKRFRDMALGKTDNQTSHMSDFQRLRDTGKLDEDEYSKLAKSIPKVIPGGVNAIPGGGQVNEPPESKELQETKEYTKRNQAIPKVIPAGDKLNPAGDNENAEPDFEELPEPED